MPSKVQYRIASDDFLDKLDLKSLETVLQKINDIVMSDAAITG